MPPLHSGAVSDLVTLTPAADAVLTEMERRAARDAFPTVGPEAGRLLALVTRLTGARSVLELGSGFGYSAYWVARALPPDGSVVLCERDESLLADARSYFERGGLVEKAVFEHGDALKTATRADGPFDLVVLDHDTADYVDGFDTVRELVAPGGALITDNVAAYRDVLTPEGLLATLDGDPAPNDRTRTVAAFYEHVLAAPEFESYTLPVDEGVLVSYRLRE